MVCKAILSSKVPKVYFQGNLPLIAIVPFKKRT